jgi:hypothetical protein
LSFCLRLGFSLWLSYQNPISIPLLPHACYMPLIFIDLIWYLENRASNEAVCAVFCRCFPQH